MQLRLNNDFYHREKLITIDNFTFPFTHNKMYQNDRQWEMLDML